MLWQGWCPFCKSHRIARLQRRDAAALLLGLMILPCRCERCDARFLKFRWVVRKRR
jgi:hypothetical protein